MKVSLRKRVVFLGLLGAGILAPVMASAAPASNGVCGTRKFSVYFAQWKAELGPDGREALTAEQQSFKGCAIKHVKIVGLAGIKGTPDENQVLSQKRADAVADFLTASGWRRDSLELIALGDKGATRDDLERPIRRRVRVTVESRPSE